MPFPVAREKALVFDSRLNAKHALDNSAAHRDDPAAMDFLQQNPAILIGLAALAIYLAARLGWAALDRNGNNPSASAAAHWLPIAAVTLAAIKQNPAMSVHLIFASSIASLMLVPGATIASLPRDHSTRSSSPGGENRAWPMVLPAALLVLLAGFHAAFTRLHAILFLLQGCAALFLWMTIAPARSPEHFEIDRRSVWLRVMMLIGWIALSLIGAAMAVQAVREFASRVPQLTGGLVAGLMLAPALALPMIGSSLSIERADDSSRADAPVPYRAVISLGVGCVLLNLCLLLPLSIILHSMISPGSELSFPISVWRIDNVVLIVLGAALIPISSGRWKLGRLEGAALILAYLIYTLTSASLAGQ